MRSALISVVGCLAVLSQVAAIVLPFEDAAFSLDRRNTAQCPRTQGPYAYCDAVTKCCEPGYGCNTCGEGNVGQTCVKRQKDGCKTDSDCYWSQKCINDGKQEPFCAQLWVDSIPTSTTKTKSKASATSSKALHASSLAPSSMIMAPSSMIMAPSSMIMAPSSMVMAPTSTKKPTSTSSSSKKTSTKTSSSSKSTSTKA